MGARRAARLDTLLDPRTRTMGLDVDFIASQEKEKHLRAEDARAEARAAAEETARQVAAVKVLERGEEAAKRAILQAAAVQSATRESTDSWDLNDPKRVLKTRPAREGLDDPALGPASAQVFAGEDPLAPERKVLQAAQFRAWLTQVQGERDALRAREQAEMMAFARRSDGTAATADAMEAETAAAARARQVAAAQFNLREIEAKAAAKRGEKLQDIAEDLATMQTLVTRGAGMGLLAEDMGDGVSHASESRIRPDYYRGRPGASGAELMRGYAEQMQTRVADRAQQKALDDRLAREAAEHSRLAAKVERRHEQDVRERNLATRAALDRQLEELKARRAAERAEHQRPGFNDHFFESFGKTDF